MAEEFVIPADWDGLNKRRLGLIDKKLSSVLSSEENAELTCLQELAAEVREATLPLQPLIEDMQRHGF